MSHRRKLVPDTVNLAKNLWLGTHCPRGEPTTIILLNGHSIQLFLKPYLSTHPRVHFSDFNSEAPMQWTVVNAHNWEQVSLKGPATYRTFTSNSLFSSHPPACHKCEESCRREGRKTEEPGVGRQEWTGIFWTHELRVAVVVCEWLA